MQFLQKSAASLVLQIMTNIGWQFEYIYKMSDFIYITRVNSLKGANMQQAGSDPILQDGYNERSRWNRK